RGWQADKRRTCALPVVLGLCPKLKYPPLCGGIFIVSARKKFLPHLQESDIISYGVLAGSCTAKENIGRFPRGGAAL
ncbi:hypothetical protein, partial [Ligaoa zhengdingensis]|uniref:hypothetical protein n=1 Tax=Ligaoa zhengdingensis TaxID=2763658 RepID=UPI0031BB219B